MTFKLTLIVLSCVSLFFGCADRNFADRNFNSNQFAGGILKGENIPSNAPFFNRIVMVAQNFENLNGKANFFGVCSGTIINSRTILTAAHCLENGIANIKVLTAVNPREKIDIRRDVFTPVNYSIHKDYLPKTKMEKVLNELNTSTEKARELTHNPDLALLYLDRDIPGQFQLNIFTPNPKLMPAENSNEVLDITITGYGRTSDLAKTSEILQQNENLSGVLKQAVISVPTIKLYHSGFYLEQWQKGGICHGDSGGPVFMKNKNTNEYLLVALAVNVFESNNRAEKRLDPDEKYNACSSHGLYLNLAPHKKWIIKTVESLADRAKKGPSELF